MQLLGPRPGSSGNGASGYGEEEGNGSNQRYARTESSSPASAPRSHAAPTSVQRNDEEDDIPF